MTDISKGIMRFGALMVVFSIAHAADIPATGNKIPQVSASATVGEKTSKTDAKSEAHNAKRLKPIDINNASLKQLHTLPGVTQTEAKKIMANRPYCSKAWLVTKKVLSDKVYGQIHALVEARMPFKEAEKNVAWCHAKAKS